VTIELYTRRGLFGRKYYFRIIAVNGQIIAQSEGYSRRVDALSTIWSIQMNVGEAEIEEL
jgi:uncharacterized protein YegP (UPF0339 family)